MSLYEDKDLKKVLPLDDSLASPAAVHVLNGNKALLILSGRIGDYDLESSNSHAVAFRVMGGWSDLMILNTATEIKGDILNGFAKICHADGSMHVF